MENIGLKDLKIKKNRKEFIGMKESDLFKIERKEGKIYGYDKNDNNIYIEWDDSDWVKIVYNEEGDRVYEEWKNGNWIKIESNKKIKYKEGKYYINGSEAELI